jgi:hypothetical protein
VRDVEFWRKGVEAFKKAFLGSQYFAFSRHPGKENHCMVKGEREKPRAIEAERK